MNNEQIIDLASSVLCNAAEDDRPLMPNESGTISAALRIARVFSRLLETAAYRGRNPAFDMYALQNVPFGEWVWVALLSPSDNPEKISSYYLTFDGNFCDIAKCDAVRYGSFCEDGRKANEGNAFQRKAN